MIFVKIVDKIILTHLQVCDMDKTKAFYTNVLGFEATQDTKWGKGNRGVFVVPPGGGTYLALDFISEQIKFDTGRNFFISTSDVEAAYRAIKAKGVKPNTRSCLIRGEANSLASMILMATSGTFYNHRSLRVT